MSARWVTFLVWALVAASAVAWGLKLFVTAQGAPPQVAVAGQSQLPRGDVTRVLGADAPPPVDPAAGETLASGPADARFQLVGVVAPRHNETARGGVALIAIDGKPPKAFPIGAVVEGDHVVQAIRIRGADLGPAGGKVAVALNIPPPAAAATGTLPSAAAGATAGGTAAAAPAGTAGPAATPPRRTVAPVAVPPPPAMAPPPTVSPPPSVAPPPVLPVQPATPPTGQVVPQGTPGTGKGGLLR